MKLICGLGNPGGEYERDRHNVGSVVVEELCRRRRVPLSTKFEGRAGLGTLDGERVLFLQPQTYMNHSGYSLAPAARFYKVEPREVLVIHDELDLPFGRLMLKQGGGTGGHRGLTHIIEAWGEEGFARLRLGIGKPSGQGAKERVTQHVLSPFNPEEQKLWPELLARAADAAECWASQGLAVAMNRYNRKGAEREE